MASLTGGRMVEGSVRRRPRRGVVCAADEPPVSAVTIRKGRGRRGGSEVRRSEVAADESRKSRFPDASSSGGRRSTPRSIARRMAIDRLGTRHGGHACSLGGENQNCPPLAPVGARAPIGAWQAVPHEVSSTKIALSSPVLVDFSPLTNTLRVGTARAGPSGGCFAPTSTARWGPAGGRRRNDDRIVLDRPGSCDRYCPGEPATSPDRQPW